jgi:hypothetical protein
MKKQMKIKTPNITLLGIILVAAFTFYQGLNLYKDIKTTSWPFVDGQINWQTYTTGPYRSAKYNRLMEPMHWKQVQFSYKVNGLINGLQYSSNNLSFGLTFSDGSELTNPYDKEQSTVKVYFNPRNPSEAVLIPGPKAINICLVALGALSTFWLIKRIRRN